MISSLEDARKWYANVKEMTLAMFAMGKKHWDGIVTE
jgi:hypothetical protein